MKVSSIQISERLYDYFLKLYPTQYKKEFGEEMRFVFSESLKNTYKENGEFGVMIFWVRICADIIKSLFTQYLEKDRKGGENMKAKKKDLIMQNKVFAWIGLATACILSIPYLAMVFQLVEPDPTNPYDQGVNWTLGDFIIMGILLFGAGSLFVVVARLAPRKYRLLIGVGFLAVLLLTWVHLAVGIVDTWPFAGN